MAARRLFAEWERHLATWIAWPGNISDWPGKFAPIPFVFAEMIRKLAASEDVYLIVSGERMERAARRVLSRAGADLSRVRFFTRPTDRGWTRDFLPLFAEDASGEVVAAQFNFNGWAKYPDHGLDRSAAPALVREAGLAIQPVSWKGRPVVLEGGAVDANGQGTLLATEECLLDEKVQARNPGFSKADYQAVFAEHLGIDQVIWLNRGIAGDDTHGHVDDVCRFVAPDTVVLCREDDPGDVNYAPLAENLERLRGVKLPGGERLEVIGLPMPRPVVYQGQRLPASYANFYVGNRVVLVPVFNDPADRIALGILAELFADREVTGIYCGDLIWGLGAVHCLTHELPLGKGDGRTHTQSEDK